MKVICNYCGELEEEEEVIKLSLAQYKQWKMNIEHTDFINFPFYDHQFYTHICQECYKRS